MIDAAQQYLSVFSTLLGVSAVLYTWITSRSRGNEAGLEKLEAKVSSGEERLTKIESEMQHLPDKDSQHRLELAMTEMAGDMKQMTEALSTTTRTVRRMEDFLLNAKGDK